MDEKRKSEISDHPVRFLHPLEMKEYNITSLDLIEGDYEFDGFCYWIQVGSRTETILSLKGMKFDLKTKMGL